MVGWSLWDGAFKWRALSVIIWSSIGDDSIDGVKLFG
jgi:hypothetical protein